MINWKVVTLESRDLFGEYELLRNKKRINTVKSNSEALIVYTLKINVKLEAYF